MMLAPECSASPADERKRQSRASAASGAGGGGGGLDLRLPGKARAGRSGIDPGPVRCGVVVVTTIRARSGVCIISRPTVCWRSVAAGVHSAWLCEMASVAPQVRSEFS